MLLKKLLTKYGPGIGITFIAIAIVTLLKAAGLFDLLSYQILDFSFKVRGPLSGWAARTGVTADSLDVVLVDVDDESFRLVPETWPYPRGIVWNRVIENLTNAGAKVIVFDIQFDSRDQYTQNVLNIYKGNPPENYNDGDRLLAEAVRYAESQGTDVIMAATMKREPTRVPPQMIVTPNQYIMSVQPEYGLVDVPEDPDGFSRQYAVFWSMEHEPTAWYLTLALKSVKDFKNLPDSVSISYNPETNHFEYGDIEIPSYGSFKQTFLVNFYGPSSKATYPHLDKAWSTFNRYPLSNVVDTEDYDLKMEDTDWMSLFDSTSSFNQMMLMVDENYEIPESPFKDKICIIGASVEVLHDYKKTPFFTYGGDPVLLPGFEFHANAIQEILDENFIRVFGSTLEFTSDSALTQIALIVFVGLLTYIFLTAFHPLVGGVLIIVEILVYLSLSIGLFTADVLWLLKFLLSAILPDSFVQNAEWLVINTPKTGGSLVVPVIAPVATILLTYGGNVIYKFLVEQKDKRFLRKAFGAYISPELIDMMHENHQQPKLGGEAAICTPYFTDIQGFSTFSEMLSAEELVTLLNEYLTEMTNILLDEKGTLDKYEGDAIIAFFGAPVRLEDHAERAVRTAIRMQNRLSELREKWKAEGDRWPEIVHIMQMRIGISSGEIVTGNMGSAGRMNYTMMGDPVNTAARLESSAKQYGVYTQISHHTAKLLSQEFALRELGTTRVKGKQEALQTFEVLGFTRDLTDDDQKLLEIWPQALEATRQQRWNDAIKLFQEAEKFERQFEGRNSNPCQTYLNDRIPVWQENPPGDEWDGVWVLTSK
ncbi:MAG: adenylate/guanylate cyclase domain-containing protein [Candidatus Marinimicrobia bacterium]|nr:adenylate/guanylate cyclase domain-containing protein [Candidatus Neomarinimicrobiota bacterium]